MIYYHGPKRKSLNLHLPHHKSILREVSDVLYGASPPLS